MIGPAQFERMKDGALIVNCARGGIFDEAATLEALESGQVAGAAFDVWSEEPPKTETLKRLIAHPRMVVTPHLGANTFEAQKNVAVDVCLELLNYLDGKPLANAVNIPRFDPDLMEHMKPFIGLVGTLGEFISKLAPPNPRKVSFTYNGKLARFDCTPLTVCGLAALLQNCTEHDVNMVNAMLVAASRSALTRRRRITSSATALASASPECRIGPMSARLAAMSTTSAQNAPATGTRMVAGTLFDGTPKIVKMRNFTTDFTPEEHMLVITYTDRPGLIGKIGTIMGKHDINIASMNLGRSEKKGEAMVILSLDSAVPAAVLAEHKQALLAVE